MDADRGRAERGGRRGGLTCGRAPTPTPSNAPRRNSGEGGSCRACGELPGCRNPGDEPAAQAHALLERLFALLHDCRAVVPAGGQRSGSAQPERLLHYALVGALEAGLVRTAEDALTALRQASQPLGPMGAGWLERQERRLEGER